MEARIDAFLRFLATEKGLSEAYQLSVSQTLVALGGWLGQKDLAAEETGTDELTEFLTTRRSEGLCPSSIRLTTVHLKIFYRWLTATGRATMDPAEPLSSSRTDRKLPSTLSVVEVESLLESIPVDDTLGRRDKAILELRNEITRLTLRASRDVASQMVTPEVQSHLVKKYLDDLEEVRS